MDYSGEVPGQQGECVFGDGSDGWVDSGEFGCGCCCWWGEGGVMLRRSSVDRDVDIVVWRCDDLDIVRDFYTHKPRSQPKIPNAFAICFYIHAMLEAIHPPNGL